MRDNQHFDGGRSTGDVRFTITDGQVTGLERVLGTLSIELPLPSDATFTVGTGTVTETLTRGSATETLTWTADTSDATLYHLSQKIQDFDTAAADGTGIGIAIVGCHPLLHNAIVP